MGQLYMQRFENWGAINKGDFDATWGVALEALGKSGNFGGVEKGVKNHGAYSTSWGGYVLIEVEDPKIFAEYQSFHYQNYAHQFRITFEPVVHMDAEFAEASKK